MMRIQGRSAKFPVRECAAMLAPLAALLGTLFLLVGDEEQIAGLFQRLRHVFPGTTAVMSWLSACGNIPFYAAYAFILVRSFWPEHRRDASFVIGYVLIMAMLLLVADMMKIWIGRPRPGVPGEYIALSLKRAQHSFPSNHLTETVFTVLPLALYHRARPLSAACGLWVAVMGFSRLFLGRHHPTDLLGSAVIGCVGVYFLWKLIRFRHGCPGSGAPRKDASLECVM